MGQNASSKEELDYLIVQLIPVFFEHFKQYCTSVGDLELASSLSGINSLPALMNIGGVYKIVEVPLSLITKLVEASGANADEAAKKANESAVRADAATVKSEAATAEAKAATTKTEAATAEAKTATDLANTAKEFANSAGIFANAAGERANLSADNADAKAEYARQYAELVKELAEHPIMVGTDNYVYTWNLTTHTYDKTDIYVRGEGFSVKKVFASVAEMEAYAGDEFKEGDFALINTGSVEDEDTAKLYSRTADGHWQFLVDMSGAIGFTGKTPQFKIGTVTVGAPDTPAGASLEADGTDGDGNPVYALSLTIPKGDTFTFADLTPEQIKLLQKPADDMIALLQQTDEAVKAAELLRVKEETKRAESETLRTESETLRINSETNRDNSEKKRVEDESQRAKDELKRQQDTAAAILATNEARDAAIAETANLADMKAAVTKATEDANAATADMVQLSKTVTGNEAERISGELSRKAEFEAWTTKVTGWEAAELKRKEDTAKAINDTNAAKELAIQYGNEAKDNAALAKNSSDYALSQGDAAKANAALAKEMADNPPKVVADFWWLYDATLKDYVNSGLSARGRSPQIIELEWWVWNDVTAEYENTHVNVNDSFQLTKQKIEDLLTGDIATHNHDSRYSTKEEITLLLSGYVQAVAGKQLSTEDFTTDLKNKLAGLSNYDDTALTGELTTLKNRLDALIGDSASSAIDTFNEIKAFLEGITDTANLATMLAEMRTEIIALIPTKLSQLANDAHYVTDSAYVHTDNNFTAAYKSKIDGIEAGANKTVVDAALNSTSLNPVQNKVLYTALAGKAASVHTHTKSQISDFPTSMPASDVYAWAKAATKPGYSYSEISGTPASLKNPYALTIKKAGVTIATYDGSSAKEVTIPDSTLATPKITGSGNVVTGISVTGLEITLTKGITALTSISKAMVEGVLTGAITSHSHSQYLTSHQDISGKLNKGGDTMTGDLLLAQNGTTGTRQIKFTCGDNDYMRLAAGATAANAGWAELATADDGNEPIYVRQYTGTFTTIKRTLTLLDANGNTNFPGSITAASVKKSGGTSNQVLMADGSVVDKGSFLSVGVNTIMRSVTIAGNIFGDKWLPCDGRVVAHSSYPLLKLPPNGIKAWTAGGGVANASSYSIAYGNGVFVYANSNTAPYWSTDGKTWTISNGINNGSLYKVVYGNGLFLCAYGSTYYWSTDGKTWTKGVEPSGYYVFEHIVYGNGLFVSISQQGYVLLSANGKTWDNLGRMIQEEDINDIAYGNGVFVCVTNQGYVYWTTDVKKWDYVSVPGIIIRHVIYGNGVFVLTDEGLYAYWSTDGRTWVRCQAPSNVLFGSLTCKDGLFVCTRGNSSCWSNDGKEWVKGGDIRSSNDNFKCIAYGGGVFVCVGDGGCTCWTTESPNIIIPVIPDHYIKAL